MPRRRRRTPCAALAVGLLAAGALVPACSAPLIASSVPIIEPAAERAPTRLEILGQSREGRPVRARRLGSGARRVMVIAGIHGDEQEGLRHLENVARVLERAPWDALLVEDANPDGTARGTRTTAAGVDPNRNWPASNFRAGRGRGDAPLSEPAVAAVHGALIEFGPELVVVLHSAGSGPFVNFDGPAERWAKRFAEGAGPPWTVRPSMGYPTPGSLGTFVGVDGGVPILTVEFRRGAPPEDTRAPLLDG
ncbi:MAG: M14 family zinc carboxypeptidase, partial [Planctomycetota bacterium]